MESTIVDAALTQSIWAGLSIALIFYILKKQELRDKIQAEREEKYQDIIKNLTDKLNVVEELREDIQEVKSIVTK